MKSTLTVILLCILTLAVCAQSEFVVNTTIDSTQRDPHIARDAAGNYVVVWKSENQASPTSRGDICMQLFDAGGGRVGGEILANVVTVGDQDRPALAMNDLGDFVVAWASYTNDDSLYDIKARIYHGGMPAGDEFLVNTTTASSQTHPSIAIDSIGNFVVVWDSWFQDGGDRGVYGRRFSADGTPLSGEFLVNSTTAYSQARPAVKSLHGGGFIILWESWNQDDSNPSGYGMYGRIYDPVGSPRTGEIQLNSTTKEYQWFGDAEIFDDNSFAAVWCSWGQDGSEGGIVLQRFDPEGGKIGSEIIVNTTTVNYQWLPRIRRLEGRNFAVVWSSWKQDGSREGVYARLFDGSGRKTSFETQVNTTTDSYQWEPDLIATGSNEILAVWSSWGQVGHDYEVVARRVAPLRSEGFLRPAVYSHTAGRSTAHIVVHVIDTLALTGNSYEAVLDSLGNRRASATIRNITTGDTLVRDFPIDRGEGVFYLTPVFQGAAVEIIPEFDLALNLGDSYFANHSGTNLVFTPSISAAGAPLMAPIDVALIWGSTDTLVDGTYAAPLDTAIGVNGVRNVVIPFKGWNLTDNQQMQMLILETKANQRWEPGERIVFRTPPQYRKAVNNTHAEIRSTLPAQTPVLPAAGDTNYVFTTRPIGPEERYVFTTDKAQLVDVVPQRHLPLTYSLSQNYPNPFNPSTVISFQLPAVSEVRLVVYDFLGREVATLVDETKAPGRYEVKFDGSGMASGVYFCRLGVGNKAIMRKMLLVR